MAEEIKPENILFIDIETVPCIEKYELLSDRMKLLWTKKARTLPGYEKDPDEAYRNKAGIFAEFSKVVCIGMGYLTVQNSEYILRTKVMAHRDEEKLLADFAELLQTHYKNDQQFALCGHNIREFDIPFLCRRLIVNDIALPDLLDIADKKPWEIHHIDTFQLWKFGDFKNYTSLDLLVAALDLPDWKSTIDGADIAHVYWQEKDLPRIADYCAEDIVAVARVFMKMKQMGKLPDERIQKVN